MAVVTEGDSENGTVGRRERQTEEENRTHTRTD
jgi:hypothetical protein